MNYLDGKRDKMYQAGLLKSGMKMRRDEDLRGFDEIFREILKDMDLDPEEFRRYVNNHMQSLMATVRKRGY